MAFSFKLRRQLTNSSIKSIPKDSVEYYTIVEVQEKLLKLCEEEKDIFDEEDVKKVVQSMSYLRRFCQRQEGNPTKTVDMVRQTLTWRKEHCLSKLTDKDIPREFYDLGAIFIHGVDHDGNAVLHVRAKYAKFDIEVKEALERFTCFMIFKALEQGLAIGKGWSLLIDLTGISMAQYDLPEVLWALKVIVNYLPSGLRNIIGYNIPWFAKPVVKIVMAFIPNDWKKIIHFVGYKELIKLVPKETIPPFIENPKEKFSVKIPTECCTLDTLNSELFGLDEAKKEYFKNYFHKTVLENK